MSISTFIKKNGYLIIITYFTILGYLISYFKQLGYLNYYRLPGAFIKLSIEDTIDSYLLLIIYLIAIFVLYVYVFISKRNDKTDPISRLITIFTFPAFFAFAPIFILRNGPVIYRIGDLVAVVVISRLIETAIWLPFFFRQLFQYISKCGLKETASKTSEQLRKELFMYMNSKKKLIIFKPEIMPYTMSILFLWFTVIAAYIRGYDSARQQTSYLATNIDASRYIVVTQSTEYFTSLRFDKDSKLTNEVALIPTNSLKIFTYEYTGSVNNGDKDTSISKLIIDSICSSYQKLSEMLQRIKRV